MGSIEFTIQFHGDINGIDEYLIHHILSKLFQGKRTVSVIVKETNKIIL